MALPFPPLANKTALVACSETKSQILAAGLEALGALVQVLPVISIQETPDKSALDTALDRIDEYSWIIFTSAYGVRFFLGRMKKRGLALDRCGHIEICAVGPATAADLETSGVRVSLVPREFVAEGILAALAERYGGLDRLAGLRILLPRARDARDLLPRALAAAGARVDIVACYEKTLPELPAAQVQMLLVQPPSLLVFTSSSTVHNFVTLFGNEEVRKMLAGTTVAVLGTITAQTLASYGKRPDIMPDENTIASLLDAIRLYFQKSE